MREDVFVLHFFWIFIPHPLKCIQGGKNVMSAKLQYNSGKWRNSLSLSLLKSCVFLEVHRSQCKTSFQIWMKRVLKK